MKTTKIQAGDRVRFTAKFCRNTGQFAGPVAPTCAGPHARGEVVSVEPTSHGEYDFVTVRWDDGEEYAAISCNLETCR